MAKNWTRISFFPAVNQEMHLRIMFCAFAFNDSILIQYSCSMLKHFIKSLAVKLLSYICKWFAASADSEGAGDQDRGGRVELNSHSFFMSSPPSLGFLVTSLLYK